MDRCGKRQQVGNQDLTTQEKPVPHSHVPGKGWWQQCWFKWDWSATATQKEKAFGFVVRTERPLLTCVFSRKEKQRKKLKSSAALWDDLDQKNTHTVISTDIRTAVTFGRSAPLWLCWLSCTCCNFSTVLPEEQQVSRLHPSPHQPLVVDVPGPNEKATLVLDVRMVAAIGKPLWLQQGIFFFLVFT